MILIKTYFLHNVDFSLKFCITNTIDMISWMEKERRKINKNDIRVWDGKSASNDIFLATRSRLSAGKNRARAYERFVTFSKTTSRPGSPTFSHLRASILGVRLHMHGMLLLTDKHP